MRSDNTRTELLRLEDSLDNNEFKRKYTGDHGKRLGSCIKSLTALHKTNIFFTDVRWSKCNHLWISYRTIRWSKFGSKLPSIKYLEFQDQETGPITNCWAGRSSTLIWNVTVCQTYHRPDWPNPFLSSQSQQTGQSGSSAAKYWAWTSN